MLDGQFLGRRLDSKEEAGIESADDRRLPTYSGNATPGMQMLKGRDGQSGKVFFFVYIREANDATCFHADPGSLHQK